MKKRHVLVATISLAILLSGCTTEMYRETGIYQSSTAGVIGCDPDEIRITNARARGYGTVHSWRAKCRGRIYQCTGQAGNVQCAPYYGKSTGKKQPVASTSHNDQERETVRKAQAKLNSLGYPVGTADGIAGRKTQTAVKSFQKDQGLSASGRLNQETLAALESAAPRKKQAPIKDLDNTSLGSNHPAPKPSQTTVAVEEIKSQKEFDQVAVEEIKSQDELEPVKTLGPGKSIDTLELKSEADPFSKTITVVAKGRRFEVIRDEGEWIFIRIDDKEGYVFSEFVERKR